MIKIKRQQYILKKLQETGSVLVADVSEELNCSTETIRRDLKELEIEHKLVRIHGGAYMPEEHDKGVPISLREKIFKKEKQHIAKVAMAFIKKGDLIFLDHSTTCLALAQEIYNANMQIIIVTNSLNIIQMFNNVNCETRVLCLGGKLRPKTGAFVGQQPIECLKMYVAESCFISCPSISIDFGLTDNSNESANIRKQMLQRSRKKILILDHTKFQSDSDIVISELKNIDAIITNRELSSYWKDYLDNLNIKVYYEREEK